MADNPLFVVATPGHTQVDEDKALSLANHGRLHFVAKGTRRGSPGIAPELTRLNPKIGFVFTAAAKIFGTFRAESIRLRLNPWFDSWVKKQLEPGNHILSSFGYTNACFKWARHHGGKAILSAGNSHPENFWNILAEEHRRWKCPDPPIDRKHYERSMAMLEDVDYVFAPSSFVANSFLTRGFKSSQILKDVYPVDLSCFTPAKGSRDKNRPLTIISTGGMSLRKGSPYLLEAFKLVLKEYPSARLRLIQRIQDSAIPIVEQYRDLPIDWSPGLPHPELAEWLRTSDIFVLPSLEDGMARTVLEAFACGLPVITTPNTGASDYVKPGVNGEVVPIRDAQATAQGILKWADKILSSGSQVEMAFDASLFSFESFDKLFWSQLQDHGLV